MKIYVYFVKEKIFFPNRGVYYWTKFLTNFDFEEFYFVVYVAT
jgi:hypothetical protein